MEPSEQQIEVARKLGELAFITGVKEPTTGMLRAVQDGVPSIVTPLMDSWWEGWRSEERKHRTDLKFLMIEAIIDKVKSQESAKIELEPYHAKFGHDNDGDETWVSSLYIVSSPEHITVMTDIHNERGMFEQAYLEAFNYAQLGSLLQAIRHYPSSSNNSQKP